MNNFTNTAPPALLTDLYQLTMAYGYWKNKMHRHEAVFHLFFRRNPFKGNYTIAAGLETAIRFLQNFQFSTDDIQYLGSLKGADNRPLFEEGFLNYLQRMQFSCDIDAIEEGMVVFPHQPLLRIQGNLIQAQLIESILLNIINFQTLVATKSARIVQAAQGDTVLEFGLRRAQGMDGSLSASRAAYIGGCHATSNVLAGRLFDIPVKGTHAHSWVMCFADEIQAFTAYQNAMPSNCIFLVDTYDTIEGVKNAIRVGQQLHAKGHELLGIRLDSGNLSELSQSARQLLDEAGFQKTAIVASDGLSETKVKALKADGAKISVWGIGTRLVTAYEQPALDGVYKMAALRTSSQDAWQLKMKLSNTPIKTSNPGILGVRRFYNADYQPIGDMIYDALLPATCRLQAFDDNQYDFSECAYEDLLVPIFKNGELVYELPDIHRIRNRSLQSLKTFDPLGFHQSQPAHYPTGLAINLHQQKTELLNKLSTT